MSLTHLSDKSRLWMFLGNRPLSETEEQVLGDALTQFVSGWQAHGKDLSAGWLIRDHALILIAVDESMEAPSGCSIDKAFRLLTEFGSRHHIDFFQRTLVAVPGTGGISIYTKSEASAAFQSGQIKEDTPVYNTLLQTTEELHSKLIIPFSSHWLGIQLLREKATP